ncbi:MAG: GNAT family N-acetyltransferase, partial [Proteobacteria bacterium]|nr:GNAT family N-acetyltransferase [Pseudomonadota bacterium]
CGDVVGMVNYHVRQSAHGRLAIGWIVVPSWRRNGIPLEAAGVLIRRCFTVLASNRIESRIAPDNQASLQLAERVGFHREGLMREWAMVDGTPRDMLLFALLRSGWSG